MNVLKPSLELFVQMRSYKAARILCIKKLRSTRINPSAKSAPGCLYEWDSFATENSIGEQSLVIRAAPRDTNIILGVVLSSIYLFTP